jgi:hypothetical protein
MSTRESLDTTFTRAVGVFRGTGTVDDLMAFLSEEVLVIDEDTPFVLDRAAFRDDLDFHLGGLWDSLAWVPREQTIEVIGTTGVITGLFTLRGKPRDAGFRLRHGNFSLVCAWQDGRWIALSLTLGPLLGHILDGSPS